MTQKVINEDSIAAPVSERLLDWYDRHRRTLPWRAPSGEHPDPYHVWLSEIMLQQTTVATVKSYFEKFLELWPTVEDLAAAPQDDVLTAWAGLGYYARARNLHKCAQQVAGELNGRFPYTDKELLALPGIGRYTAAAIASIAFDKRAVVVDGNVERVMARLFDSAAELPREKGEFYRLAGLCTPEHRPGDYAQAVMDLGATICTPRSPKCTLCPLVDLCQGKDHAEDLPRKAPKKAKPTRRGYAFWLERRDGTILLCKRPDKGLLGGMTGFPGSEWTEDSLPPAPNTVPIPVTNLKEISGTVRHTFTHFHLELSLFKGDVVQDRYEHLPEKHFWARPEEFDNHALPTVMRKAAALANDELSGDE